MAAVGVMAIMLVLCFSCAWGSIAAGDDLVSGQWVLTPRLCVLPVFPKEDVFTVSRETPIGVARRICELFTEANDSALQTHIALTAQLCPEAIWYERRAPDLVVHANGVTIVIVEEDVNGHVKQALVCPSLMAELSIARDRWEMWESEPGSVIHGQYGTDAGWQTSASASLERIEFQKRLWAGDVVSSVGDLRTRQIVTNIQSLTNTDVIWRSSQFCTTPSVSNGLSMADVNACGSSALASLIEMLDDQDKFVVAHVLLLQITGRSTNTRREFDRSGRLALVVCDQLRVSFDAESQNASYPERQKQQAWIHSFWSAREQNKGGAEKGTGKTRTKKGSSD